MQLEDFKYQLPTELIAQYPLKRRRDSRMLCLDGQTGRIGDRHFSDLPDFLQAGDLLVFNNTRVIPARFFGRKDTGGKVEVLIERIIEPGLSLAHVRANRSVPLGAVINLSDGCRLKVESRKDDLFVLRSDGEDFVAVMARHGHMPLPPYISRHDGRIDEERYQTVYAKTAGAVAAPTAGLHFDHAMIDELAKRGVERAEVTLHVGSGTFQPVRSNDLNAHRMHSEYAEVSETVCRQVRRARELNKRVIAVGTTSVRSLEAASEAGALAPFRGETRLFIRPGYRFRIVDAMLTNFHLPESTLLMLVTAFGGFEQVMAAYRHAVENRYRFFSYGDAMFLTRRS